MQTKFIGYSLGFLDEAVWGGSGDSGRKVSELCRPASAEVREEKHKRATLAACPVHANAFVLYYTEQRLARTAVNFRTSQPLPPGY